MRLHRVRLLNFRQHADTTIHLDLGLTGVVGPNGAGKSTLLEAIAWAMYGTPAARGTRDSIRRRSAPPRSRVEVELEFELGPHRYRLVRSLQAAALYLVPEAAPIANSPAAVTEQVTRRLGMTRDEFFNTYFTGQKELAIMGTMNGPERARFLSRVLGYERLAIAQNRLRETRTALRAAHQTAESGLVDPAVLAQEEAEADTRQATARAAAAGAREAAARTARAATELAPRWAEAQRQREEVLSLESDLRVAQHGVDEARRAFQDLDRQLAESLAAKARCDELRPSLDDWDALVARRDALDRDAQAFAGRRALEAQVREVEAQCAAAVARRDRLPDPALLDPARADLRTRHDAVTRAAQLVEQRHSAWVRDKQDAETKRASLLEQHEDVSEQLRRLRASGPTVVCPTCGKELGREYQTVVEDLEARLDEITVQGKFYRQRIEQLAAEPAEVVEARHTLDQAERDAERQTAVVARLESGVAERQEAETALERARQRLLELEARLAATPGQYDEVEHRAVRERLATLEPVREQLTRLTVAADRAAELVPRFAEAEQRLSRAESNARQMTERLAQLGWSPEAFEVLRARVETAERERRVAELAAIRAEADVSAADEHRRVVASRREERDRRQREVDRLRDELVLHQELDRAFTDLRDELNGAIRPELSDTASVLIRDLTNGRYTDFELNEDYRPTIMDDGEAQTVISGGEEDIANLALRLAISQMIADRAGQPFSLLVLDEIFGSLDEERRGSVVDLLRGLADRFPQVILITHIESVRDGFDRVVRIDYDRERGVAVAREETPRVEVPHVAA